jgi:FAD:protein FMN transferase
MEPLIRRSRPLLGTFVEIGIRGGSAAIFEQAFREIEQVHERMSAHSAESDLAKIALQAHRQWVTVDATTADVIRCSLEWAKESAGAFDPIRAAVELVHSKRRPWFCEELPDPIATWQALEIDGLRVRAATPLAIDLGGVAKGYAVDLAAAVITDHGGSGIVNAGGDLRFIGDEERSAFIRNPDVAGTLFELREIPFAALATTGNYAFSEEQRNLDLINPLDSKSIFSSISITVFGPNCALADAMTKVVLNSQAGQAASVLEKTACRALILENGGRHRELP